MRKRVISGEKTNRGNPYISKAGQGFGGHSRGSGFGYAFGSYGQGHGGFSAATNADISCNERYVNYDMLRIVAAWLIIVLHLSAGYGCFGVLPAISRIGVPIFIMITGTFLLNPDKDLQISLIFTRYLPKIIVVFIGWSAFYAFYVQGIFDFIGLSGGLALNNQLALAAQTGAGSAATAAGTVGAAGSAASIGVAATATGGGAAGVVASAGVVGTAASGIASITGNIDWELFWENFAMGHYHMWYLYMLAGLYIITPFLKCITETGERTIIAYFLTLCVIITSVTKLNDAIWHIELLDGALDKLALTFVFGYVGYYLAGHYYDHYALFAVERGALYIVGVGALAFTVWYTLQTCDASTLATATAATGMPGTTAAAATGTAAAASASTVPATILTATAPPTAVLYSNYSPTVFLMSFAVFAGCAAWRRHNFDRRFSRFIGVFPKYMLVVYLVHPFVITELSNRLLLKGARIANAYGVEGSMVGSLYHGISGTIESTLAIDAVIVFTVSLAISVALMQLWLAITRIVKKISK